MDRRCIKQFKQWLPKEHNNKVELVRVFTLFLPLKKIKMPFQTDQAGGKNLPFQTKTDTCGEKCPFETKRDATVWTNDQTGRTNLPFQTKKGYVWTQDQTGGENLPFQTKTDTCGQGRSCIYPRIHSSRPSLLNGSDIVNLKHEVFMITSRFPSLYHNRDFPFILLFFFFSREISGIL